MNTSAIFEYAYRNPDSEVAQELFAIYDDIDYDEVFADDLIPAGTKAITEKKAAKGKVLGILGRFIQNVKDEAGQYKDAARVVASKKSGLTPGQKMKAVKQAMVGVTPGTAGRKKLRDTAVDDFRKNLRHPDAKTKEHSEENSNDFSLIGTTVVAGGLAGITAGVRSIIKKIQEGKEATAKELAELEEAQRQLEASGHAKEAAIVGSALALAGGGAALGRHMYLKHRMKQTGAKSKKEVKEIIGSRKVTKKALLAKGNSPKRVRELLKEEYGY